jgi:hypothetical protein
LAISYAQTALGVATTSEWNFVNEDSTSYSMTLFSAEEQTLLKSLKSGLFEVHCDLSFRLQRDDSWSRSKFTYLDLDTNTVHTQKMKGGYQNHQRFEMPTCSKITCTKASRGASCPWESKNAILLAIDFDPRDGKAHRNQWHRNKFSFSGTHYYVTRDLGMANTNEWNFVNEDATSYSVSLFSAEEEALLKSGSFEVHCDISFRLQRDDSWSRSKFTYLDLDTNTVHTQKMKGGYQNHQRFEMPSCSKITCTKASRGASCPWESKNAILLAIDFDPRDGKAHRNQWHRNKFTFSGTHYYVTRAFYKETGSEQCELALNDWCVQNSPYKYARFDVGQNQQDFKQWRCYSSGALTEDTFMTDLAAMELYPGNKCPSIAQGAIAGVPEPTEATCFGHWTRQSELKIVLDSPACAFYKHAGSKQCESALNDWCVQNSPYKYARFDVGQNQQSTNRWRCYTSGALTDDTYSVDFDAMGLYPENRCPSIAQGAIAGVPEPTEARCFGHWSKDSELKSVLGSPVCGPAFYKHAGSKQCEAVLNDWCVQNTPYKYARFDVAWNAPDTKGWRCYSSGALTEDTYSADMAAMSVSENKCRSTAGIPEPNEATCWNHWSRNSELTSILDSPVCGQDFFVQLAVGVTECPLGYGYVTTNEECQAARTELQITRWNDEDNKSASDRGAYCWIRHGWKANFNPAGDFGTDFSESSLICKLELPSNTRRLLKLNA